MTHHEKRLHWFRRDLRLADNPALQIKGLGTTLGVYIVDPTELKNMGDASRVWLEQSLAALNRAMGRNLWIEIGPAAEVLRRLISDHDITHVTWTRRYDPAGIAVDSALKAELSAANIQVHSVNGSLLWEPWQVAKPDGTPYRVFTPFFKNGCHAAPEPRRPLPKAHLNWISPSGDGPPPLAMLRPKLPWPEAVLDGWTPGEGGAADQWHRFKSNGLSDYKEGRDYPARLATSRMSPYLTFGEVSPNQLWYDLGAANMQTQHFRRELAWREFSYHLLYQHPRLTTKNLNSKFDAFPWARNPDHLNAWQRGQTGVPIVDAGMRELWQTGYMHNRVRMIVASFLVKNLLIDWRAGAAWFHDTLFDADLANNTASWQWVAGCGADAAPYFRIFNPVTQGQKFDAEGDYIRRFVPELSGLPRNYLFAPWTTPDHVLRDIGITLGDSYPCPLVDLKESRVAALDAFAALSKNC